MRAVACRLSPDQTGDGDGWVERRAARLMTRRGLLQRRIGEPSSSADTRAGRSGRKLGWSVEELGSVCAFCTTRPLKHISCLAN